MNELSELGFEFSIDDFGTGYSSLNYIMHLPIDEIKIDRTFIQGIGNEDKSLAIVNAILGMSKGLGLRVVAEGVEEEQQIKYLKSYQCSVYQGYYYSKPLSVEQWITFIEEVNRVTC
jgi:EAL domain-containing protein (putative c-di-GMP-specific phosphodiesterase class I)